MLYTAQCPPQLLGRIVLCANSFDQLDISGQLCHATLENPRSFSGTVEMVAKMEQILDGNSYPQPHFSSRSFIEQTQTKRQQQAPIEEVLQHMDEEVLQNIKGEKATFVIQVQFRQNATWQGTISWTEEKKTQRFRSALELIKLMDSALSHEEEQPDEAWD